jgi:hypothetical protein
MAKEIKIDTYSEADLIEMFNLIRLEGNDEHPLMKEWVETNTTLTDQEAFLFDTISKEVRQKIAGWKEETLKMKFISFVLFLGNMVDNGKYSTYFEETISATVEGHFLKTQTDFMVSTGILDKPKKPFFHFQEYKKFKNPSGDPVPQLIEAFLIAQEKNQNGKPLYGCTVTGKYWDFFIMEGKTYCISKSYDCTERDDLMLIIAILRKFVVILNERLLD